MSKKPTTVQALTDFGRVQLSKSFFTRDFLFSDIAAIHGFNNAPDNRDLAIAAGTKLCEELLEPLQDRFGRVAIRSAFRPKEVNGYGNEMQRAKRRATPAPGTKTTTQATSGTSWTQTGTWARRRVVVPSFWDHFQQEGDWRKLAWWTHDHLPNAGLYFVPTFWAFNISWHEKPVRSIRSYASPLGTLTAPGMANVEGSHQAEWAGIEVAFR